MEEKTLTPRLMAFDLLKLFAIYLVILGHVLQYLIGYEYCLRSRLWLSIYTFHVPLFMVIAGYFFNTGRMVTRHDMATFVRKRSVQLLKPCLFFSVLLIACYACLSLLFHVNLLSVSTLFQILVLDEWFLKSLWLDTVLVVAYFYMCRYLPNLISGGVICLFITCYVLLPASADLWSVRETIPLFVIGIFLRKIQHRISLGGKYTTILFLLFSLMMFLGYDRSFSSQFTQFGYSLFSVYAYCYRILYAASISITLISALLFVESRKILSHRIFTRLSNVGRETLHIYLLQYLLLERIFCFVKLPILVSEWFTIGVVCPVLALCVLFSCHALYRLMLHVKSFIPFYNYFFLTR